MEDRSGHLASQGYYCFGFTRNYAIALAKLNSTRQGQVGVACDSRNVEGPGRDFALEVFSNQDRLEETLITFGLLKSIEDRQKEMVKFLLRRPFIGNDTSTHNGNGGGGSL